MATSWLRTAKAKRFFSFCRWLHIYVSCTLFSLLVFFSLTGITLNHPSWTAQATSEIQSLPLPVQFAQFEGEYPLNALQAYIEQKTALASPRSIDVLVDMGEITFDYPLPAGYAFVTVLLDDQLIEIERSSQGLLGLVNDLHKGRHSGNVWSVVIDVSAGLILLFSITGLIILLQNAKHRRMGFMVVALGSITPLVVYLIAVPR
ncbi:MULTISPECIES: PepSY-associated TM helix domain-containing protein [Shewanella]|uniref:PepSY-associated TM helix domain-containing protein n=1 Tax=Shewanella TaxID=22 RepID=UPI002495A71F|nr:PepSY-associated TM helix domain-containing protein [Shewanella japonica]